MPLFSFDTRPLASSIRFCGLSSLSPSFFSSQLHSDAIGSSSLEMGDCCQQDRRMDRESTCLTIRIPAALPSLDCRCAGSKTKRVYGRYSAIQLKHLNSCMRWRNPHLNLFRQDYTPGNIFRIWLCELKEGVLYKWPLLSGLASSHSDCLR